MSFISLLITFAPWIVFKIINNIPLGDPMLQAKVGVVVAAIILAYQAKCGLHRGFLLIGGVCFFSISLVMVVLLSNVWYLRHLAILSHFTLAAFTWLSILLKEPFTMAYAKENTDPRLWTSPKFIQQNNQITTVWGASFTLCMIDALIKWYHPEIAGFIFEIVDYSGMVLAALYTSYRSKKAREARIAVKQ